MEIGMVSRTLGVPAPTLRRWTREFQGGLRPEAFGGDGRPRSFTPRDVRVLKRAKELLGDGLTYAQARERLAEEGLLQPAEAEAAAEGPGPATPEEREAAERYVGALFERFIEPTRREHAALALRLAELERRVAELTRRLEGSEEALARAAPAPAVGRPAMAERAPERPPEPPRRTWPFRS